ncbi:MAG: hypothetical protein GX162_13865 [Firmicutes bacterium]|jgi:hypothetical protein|nr:hypothetical protein [Bacillota bacterium]
MNYQYTVTVANGGLSGGINGGGFLDVEMRYAAMLLDDDPGLPAENGSEWNPQTFTFADQQDNTVTVLDGGNILQTWVIYQQFCVPFNRSVPAGRYTGTVTFTAATI